MYIHVYMYMHDIISILQNQIWRYYVVLCCIVLWCVWSMYKYIPVWRMPTDTSCVVHVITHVCVCLSVYPSIRLSVQILRRGRETEEYDLQLTPTCSAHDLEYYGVPKLQYM